MPKYFRNFVHKFTTAMLNLMMISPVGVLVTVVILALLVSLIIMLRISSKMADSNARLIDRVTSLEQSTQQQESSDVSQKPSDLPQEQPATVLQNGLPTDMTNDELYHWFDGRMDALRLFCQPDIDLKTTAQTLGLTQRSILQMLKTTDCNLTFTEYITGKRLAYACRLLQDKPHWNIDAVAREAGIQSDATFRRLFRKHYGMSPSEYRERRIHSDFVTH
jgi:AraC-like DNA-binding protein